VIRGRSRLAAVSAGVMLVHAVVAVAVIWGLYGFRYPAFRTSQPGRDWLPGGDLITPFAPDTALGDFVRFTRDHRLLPEAYLHGHLFTVVRSRTRTAFLNGEYSVRGWRHFFPYTFWVKTPLPVFLLLLAALLASAARWFARARGSRPPPGAAWRRARRSLYRTAPIWAFLTVYWALVIGSHINIGHRHILPTYPLMFVLCGSAAGWIRRRHWAAAVATGLALLWLVVESASIHPHYLAYFNQAAGGPRHGYRHLIDSSLDWGQDLPGLKRRLDELRGDPDHAGPVYLSYFGTGNPFYYGLKVTLLPCHFALPAPVYFPYSAGTYCISATMLQGAYNVARGAWTAEQEAAYQQALAGVRRFEEALRSSPGIRQRLARGDPGVARWAAALQRHEDYRFARLCAYLRLREPDEQVGYSILIYFLSQADIERALSRPPKRWTPSTPAEGK
jgi:hypothetical protein